MHIGAGHCLKLSFNCSPGSLGIWHQNMLTNQQEIIETYSLSLQELSIVVFFAVNKFWRLTSLWKQICEKFSPYYACIWQWKLHFIFDLTTVEIPILVSVWWMVALLLSRSFGHSQVSCVQKSPKGGFFLLSATYNRRSKGASWPRGATGLAKLYGQQPL